MSDGRVEIDATLNSEPAEKGLKTLSNKLNSFAKKLKSSDMANLGMSITGIGSAFKMATTAIKATTKAIKETSEAYRVQLKAETQLNQAIKNSPILDGSSAKALKDYASAIQSASTYGDEELLPFMAELANAGRSQQEIMDIIQASVDVASSGMMDLGSAVSALNMTFQGTTGTLGRQISAIKNLTAEELKSGKAIEIIKKQFAGTAEEVAKATGSSEQLANAWGDLKEEIGAGFEKNMAPLRKFFTELINGWTDAKKSRREYEEASDQNAKGKDTTNSVETELKGLQAEYQTFLNGSGSGNTYQSLLAVVETGYANGFKATADQIKKANEELDDLRENDINFIMYESQRLDYQKRIADLKEKQKKHQEEDKSNAEALKLAQEEADKQAEINKANEEYLKIIEKRDSTIKSLQLEAEALGQEVDKQAILNAEMTAYLEISKNPALEDKAEVHLKAVKSLAEEQAKLNDAQEKYNKLQGSLDSIEIDMKKSDILKEQLRLLDEINEALLQSSGYEQISAEKREAIAQEYADKRKELEKQITEAVQAEGDQQLTKVSEILNTVNSFVGQFSEIIGNISDMVKDNAEAQATTQTAEVEKQFADGIISEEEYYKRKEQIEKESAKKQYQAQMWEWSASLLQIGASTAQAIVNALQTKPTALGIAMAGTVGVLGASQLAMAIANKPIPPSFASGGIVGGSAYSIGDNIRSNIKSGEMILNDKQQLNLWRMAQGAGASGAGAGTNIQIKNYRGNDTSVTPQITEDGIKILIRKTVSDDMANRKFNDSLMSAQNSMDGVKYSS